MTIEIRYDGPPEFKPLFTSFSARDALKAADTIIREGDIEKQKALLGYAVFMQAVNSALVNLDQRSRGGAWNIVSAFDKEVQPIAHQIFFGESN